MKQILEVMCAETLSLLRSLQKEFKRLFMEMWIVAWHSGYIAVISGSDSWLGARVFRILFPAEVRDFYLLQSGQSVKLDRSSRLSTDGAY